MQRNIWFTCIGVGFAAVKALQPQFLETLNPQLRDAATILFMMLGGIGILGLVFDWFDPPPEAKAEVEKERAGNRRAILAGLHEHYSKIVKLRVRALDQSLTPQQVTALTEESHSILRNFLLWLKANMSAAAIDKMKDGSKTQSISFPGSNEEHRKLRRLLEMMCHNVEELIKSDGWDKR